jgi:hypothetical protein
MFSSAMGVVPSVFVLAGLIGSLGSAVALVLVVFGGKVD